MKSKFDKLLSPPFLDYLDVCLGKRDCDCDNIRKAIITMQRSNYTKEILYKEITRRKYKKKIL